MKKLFVIVLAAIGMVSCMNTDEVIEVNNDNAIAFADAFIENSVRAEINNDTLKNFEVWGWMQENAVEAPVFNAMKVSHNGADWTYSPAQYWVPGFTYYFKALSSNNATHPNWVADVTTDGKLGEVEFTNVDGTEDLIYAAPAAVAAPNLGTTAQPVKLEFNHQLAKVKFDFDYATELVKALELSGLTVEAEEITMKVPGKATIDYSATTPAWILDTTAPQATLHFAKEGVERLTIPAGAAYEYDITFKVKYYQGTNVIKTIDKTAKISLAIEMGKAYNFTATITPDNLGLTTIDFETKVDGWDDAGAGFEPDAAPMAFVPAERTIYVNSAEQLLYLTELNAKWAELFSNGQGTEYSNYATQNGGQGTDYYYKWDWTIKLNADIDLKNITLNAPIDMRKWAFDGLGHTIKNVKIETATDVVTSAALFMGDGYTEFKDLKLENVHVKGSLEGNSTAAILVSDCSGASVENITITNSSVWGGKYTGGVVGYGYTSVNNCTLTNCEVKGGYKCGGVIGYICTSSANGKSVNNNTLTGCTVKGTDGQFAVGKSEYILGKVVGNFNCDGTCDNNKIENMTTSATANIGKVEAGKTVLIDGYKPVVEGVGMDDKGIYHILNATGWNWMEAQTDAFFSGKTVALGKDIDFNGATITPIRFWDSENRTIFDGKNCTVKNFVINGGDNSALFNGTLDVKNLKIDNATVSGSGYVAIVGGNIYGSIDNVHITNSTVFGNYWQVGGFAGQFNSGNITNCSIKNTTITGPSAVGALAGITNETRNERKFENCVVEGCTIVQNYSFGSDYDICYGVATGLINFDNGSVYFTNVTMTNNTIKGAASSVLYGECPASTTVYVDGLLPVASGLGLNAEGAYVVTTGEGFKTVATTILADGTKNVTVELANDIDLAGIEWPAVCTNAAFELDGKGYAIKNLTTSAVEEPGFYSTAMFTSTRKATTIKNLVVENATVTGKGGDNSHGAVLVACNYAALTIEGVTVKNSTISNCDRTGGLVTYLYFATATVKDCVVEGCTINSIGTAGAILGMNNDHNFEMKGCQVVNTTVSSSEGNNKAGILIGTWQDAGTLTKENNTIENSKAINAGVETNNEIGRHA